MNVVRLRLTIVDRYSDALMSYKHTYVSILLSDGACTGYGWHVASIKKIVLLNTVQNASNKPYCYLRNIHVSVTADNCCHRWCHLCKTGTEIHRERDASALIIYRKFCQFGTWKSIVSELDDIDRSNSFEIGWNWVEFGIHDLPQRRRIAPSLATQRV